MIGEILGEAAVCLIGIGAVVYGVKARTRPWLNLYDSDHPMARILPTFMIVFGAVWLGLLTLGIVVNHGKPSH